MQSWFWILVLIPPNFSLPKFVFEQNHAVLVKNTGDTCDSQNLKHFSFFFASWILLVVGYDSFAWMQFSFANFGANKPKKHHFFVELKNNSSMHIFFGSEEIWKMKKRNRPKNKTKIINFLGSGEKSVSRMRSNTLRWLICLLQSSVTNFHLWVWMKVTKHFHG